MLQLLTLKQPKKWLIMLLFFCFSGGYTLSYANNNIVIVDIRYELFAALGEYEELRNQEKRRRRSLDAQVIPVLQIILQEYTHQYDTLQTLAQQFEDPAPLQQRLEKITHFIDLFKDELTYRKTMLELQEAIKKQQNLMETQ